VQIVSLGAGTDTRYFRYIDRGHKDQVLYHELDFPIISANKLGFIQRSATLAPPGSEFWNMRDVPDQDPEKKIWGYYTDNDKKAGYLFHPLDLRALPVEIDCIRTDLPTLLVSECCLCYLTTEQADAVLNFFTSRIPTIGTVIYEPTNPNSAFGRVMTSNLAARNLAMPSISTYDSLDAQLERLRAAGLDMFQEGASINWLWDNWVEDTEKVRLGQIQMFDEEEEWKLLGAHYLVVWGAREQKETEGAFGGWDFLEGEEERRIRETGEE
jgi:[phosphatase 2A protein]-leucine-carboxy methyltransferase